MSFRVSVFIFFVLLLDGVVHSQEDVLILKEDPGSEQSKELTPELIEQDEAGASHRAYHVLYKKWREFERSFALGKASDAERALNDVIRLRTRYSIPKITELAIGTIRLGDAALARKETEKALKLYRAAAGLDPSLPVAFYSQAKAQLTRGLPGLIPAIQAATEGVKAPLTTLSGKIHFYSKFSLVVTAALLMLAFVFSLALLIKYRSLLVHEVMERFDNSNPVLIDLMVWAVLFLPVLLFLGPLWLAPFWLMIFWGYSRPPEKIVSVLFFVVFALAYPVYRHVIRVSEVSTDPSIALFVDVFSEGPSPKSVASVNFPPPVSSSDLI